MNSPARIGRQPPSLSGAPWPGVGSTPLPSIEGWAKPSAKPKCSVPPGSAEPDWPPTTVIPPWRSIASRSIASRLASAAGSWALIITSTWISPRPNGASQCSGALSPTSPSSSARAAIPERNSSGKPASDVPGTPSASSPA